MAAVLCLPWLYPFAGGPSPAVEPWLFSAACGLLVWGCWTFQPATPDARARTRASVATSWLLAAAVSSVFGLLQYFDLARQVSPWVNIAPAGEAFANLRQRNQLASLTNIGLLALAWLAAARAEGPGGASDGVAHRRWSLAAAGMAAALLAAANAATASRTGLAQLALVALLVAGPKGPERPWRLRLALSAVFVYLVAALALPPLLELQTGQAGSNALGRMAQEPGCSSRKVLWSNVLYLIAQRPWTGWGWGELDYAHFVTLYPGERFCDILDNAHNLPLHLAVELGIPLAVLLCGALLLWIVRERPWLETDPTRRLAWGVLAVIGLHSLLEYPLWYGPFQIAVVLCLWLLHAARRRTASRMGMTLSLTPPLRAAVAMVAAAGLGLAAWDYWRVGQIYHPPEERAAPYRDGTLEKLRNSWLFANQFRFAELTLTPLTRENAAWTYREANALLHYSPEPRVIEKLIESAVLLGQDEQALGWLARYRAAFPAEHARWAREHALPLSWRATPRSAS